MLFTKKVALGVLLSAGIILGAGYVTWKKFSTPAKGTLHIENCDPSASAVIVFYSGDGGWRSFDVHLTKKILEYEPNRFSIIGVDSLRYFSTPRDAVSSAKDMEQILAAHASQQQKVILLGFSLGADILPEIFNNLGAQTKARIAMVGLLSPGPYAQFQLSLNDMLLPHTVVSKNIHPTLPEVRKIDPGLLVCVFGDQGLVDTICPDPWFEKAQLIGLPGNHHFDKKYDILAKYLVESIDNHLH